MPKKKKMEQKKKLSPSFTSLGCNAEFIILISISLSLKEKTALFKAHRLLEEAFNKKKICINSKSIRLTNRNASSLALLHNCPFLQTLFSSSRCVGHVRTLHGSPCRRKGGNEGLGQIWANWQDTLLWH